MDAYFNSAPPDQQLAALRGDESVLMSGLHPGIAEVTWRLPGVRAHAVLDLRGSRREVSLEADTLWIEGERLRCAITWRGSIALDAADEFTALFPKRDTRTLDEILASQRTRQRVRPKKSTVAGRA